MTTAFDAERPAGDMDEATAGLGRAGRRAWQEAFDRAAARAAARTPVSPWVVHPPDGRLDATTTVDWTGLPLRAATCLPRADALRLLDWAGPSGCEGRLRLQDEYVEWRVLRDPDGVVRRVELTTELPEFWRVLAAHAPAEALRVAAGFAGEKRLPPSALFGATDPFRRGVTPQDREAAFAAAMLDPPGPYNSGERSICCMANRSNTLEAIVSLLCAAAFAFTQDGASGRAASARHVIPVLSGAAQDGRGSDPLLVERLARLATERRLVGLADPAGVFIVGVEHGRLRRPDGQAVPSGWFTPSRGAPGQGRNGQWRHRRLVVEAPAGEGLRVGDLIDAATEQPIRFGGQVADLVQLAVALRVSAPGAMPADPRPCGPPAGAADAAGCAAVRAAWDDFGAAGGSA